MSEVTDILLCTAICDGSAVDDEHPSADRLSAWLTQRHGPACALKKIDGYAGGNKAMQADVYGVAVNWCDVEGLVEAFLAIPWEHRESAQLLVKRENDEAFQVIRASR